MSSDFTTPATSKHNYQIQGDGTEVDKFVLAMAKLLGDSVLSISVGGYNLKPPRKKNSENHIQIHPNPNSERLYLKEYKIHFILADRGIVSDVKDLFLRKLAWEKGDPYAPSFLEKYDFYADFLHPLTRELTEKLSSMLPPKYKEHYFRCSLGLKADGSLSLHARVILEISPRDIFYHCGSDIKACLASNFIDQFIRLIDIVLRKRPEMAIKIYNSVNYRKAFFREIENSIRSNNDIPRIGEGHISQNLLYKKILEHYPTAQNEASPDWLKPQRFDIYVPEKRLAIEYNGAQHYEPIEIFGGKKGLLMTQKRDGEKMKKSLKNRTHVLIWHHHHEITDDNVRRFVIDFENKKSNFFENPLF